jgi:hypothetical protein
MISGIGPGRAAGCALALTMALAGCGNSGGASATGGQGGATGGTIGGGGAGGAGASDASGEAAASPFVVLFDFSTAAQAGVAQVANTSDTNAADLGVFINPPDGGTRAMASWDSAVGSPAPGSLEIQLPCTAFGQFVDYQMILPIITDMGGRTLSMSIRLDSGFSPADAPGHVLVYAKSGDNWDWGQASPQTIDPAAAGTWVTYTFAMSKPGTSSSPSFDPGYVKAVGIQLSTGSGNGGTDLPTPAVFHVDNIGYE